jgi:hypothetical protein
LGDIQDVLRPVADNVHPTDMSHTVIDNACAAGGSDTLTKRLRQAVAPELVALGPQTSDLRPQTSDIEIRTSEINCTGAIVSLNAGKTRDHGLSTKMMGELEGSNP